LFSLPALPCLSSRFSDNRYFFLSEEARMNKIRHIVENNLGITMVVFCFAGLAFPYGAWIPDETIIAVLAILMFLSCFKITEPLRSVFSWKAVFFCLLRYAALPVVLWMGCREIAPTFALGVLLLALCPAATSAAAFSGIYKGNVALALVITIVSSLASIFLIPATIGALQNQTIAVPVLAMLKTLSLCILLPGGLYLLLRDRELLKNYSQSHGRFTSVVLVNLMVFVAMSKTRDYFLVNPQDLIVPVFIASGFQALATLLSFSIRAAKQDRIAYCVCSAFYNGLLGTGLAVLYFDEKTIAVMLAANLIWTFMPAFMQPIIKRLQARSS
jgi:predicted Na+-dependent transporter